MAYDKDIKTETVDVNTKRRISRLTFYRTDSGVKSEAILDEAKLVNGEVIANDQFVVTTEFNQFKNISGFGSFFNGYIDLVSGLKDEFDTSGSLATGSLHSLE